MCLRRRGARSFRYVRLMYVDGCDDLTLFGFCLCIFQVNLVRLLFDLISVLFLPIDGNLTDEVRQFPRWNLENSCSVTARDTLKRRLGRLSGRASKS